MVLSVCDLCFKTFRNSDVLDQHKIQMHARRFACLACEQVFYDLEAFETHMSCHSDTKLEINEAYDDDNASVADLPAVSEERNVPPSQMDLGMRPVFASGVEGGTRIMLGELINESAPAPPEDDLHQNSIIFPESHTVIIQPTFSATTREVEPLQSSIALNPVAVSCLELQPAVESCFCSPSPTCLPNPSKPALASDSDRKSNSSADIPRCVLSDHANYEYGPPLSGSCDGSLPTTVIESVEVAVNQQDCRLLQKQRTTAVGRSTVSSTSPSTDVDEQYYTIVEIKKEQIDCNYNSIGELSGSLTVTNLTGIDATTRSIVRSSLVPPGIRESRGANLRRAAICIQAAVHSLTQDFHLWQISDIDCAIENGCQLCALVAKFEPPRLLPLRHLPAVVYDGFNSIAFEPQFESRQSRKCRKSPLTFPKFTDLVQQAFSCSDRVLLSMMPHTWVLVADGGSFYSFVPDVDLAWRGRGCEARPYEAVLCGFDSVHELCLYCVNSLPSLLLSTKLDLTPFTVRYINDGNFRQLDLPAQGLEVTSTLTKSPIIGGKRQISIAERCRKSVTEVTEQSDTSYAEFDGQEIKMEIDETEPEICRQQSSLKRKRNLKRLSIDAKCRRKRESHKRTYRENRKVNIGNLNIKIEKCDEANDSLQVEMFAHIDRYSSSVEIAESLKGYDYRGYVSTSSYRSTPEYRLRDLERHKRKYHSDPEFRQRLLARQREQRRVNSELRKRKKTTKVLSVMPKRQKQVDMCPENDEQSEKAAVSYRYRSDPAYREKILQERRERYRSDPEYRERVKRNSKAGNRYRTNPEYRRHVLSRMKERYQKDDEYREKVKQSAREAFVRKCSGGPDYLSKVQERKLIVGSDEHKDDQKVIAEHENQYMENAVV